MITQQEELRRIINLIENAQEPTNSVNSTRKDLVKDIEIATTAAHQFTNIIANQELDEVNWKKGLAGVAAAGALALGAGAAHAETFTLNDWSRAGYCMGVTVAANEAAGLSAAAQQSKLEWANQLESIGRKYGKAEFDAFVYGGKLARNELGPNSIATPQQLHQRVVQCTSIFDELGRKATRR